MGITETKGPISKQDVKLAYHRALLLHHPDKSQAKVQLESATSDRDHDPQLAHSVDEITTAYKILSDPSTRAEYDQSQRLLAGTPLSKDEQLVYHTGLETVDLDDIPYDDKQGIWHRSCRCGEARGFLVNEEDLEKEAELGEIYVTCKGCSLWLRLLFAASTSPVASHSSNDKAG